MSILSGRIREAREYVNYPPELMAAELGVTAGEYEAFEAGQVELSDAQIAAIAWICGTTLDRLKGAPLQADRNLAGAVVCRMSGDLTHDDVWEVARFAEFCMVRATTDPRVTAGESR